MLNRLQSNWVLVLAAAGLVLSISMGVRQTFGLVMEPMTAALGTGRETFGIAMAIQNLLWGITQPIAGMVADKYGTGRVLITGMAAYAGGLWLMGTAESALGLHLGGGVLIGLAMSGTAFAVVLGAVGRMVPAHKRSMALGLASAGGSFGQFVMPPIGQAMINALGWNDALIYMIVIVVVIAPLSVLLLGGSHDGAAAHATDDTPTSVSGAVREAANHKGYWLLTLGFFVCGFQVVFVAIHLPAYIVDVGLSPELGATALALIGLFNIIGTWGCGALGAKYSPKYLLSLMYVARSAVVVVFLWAPKTELTVLTFSAAMGLLWLGTVPLTSGLVARVFGPRYMATLFGIVFFSHQVGSFLGVWMGGALFDSTGSYDVVWWISIGLGVVAAALHLPIVEASVRKPVAQAAQ